MSKLTLLLHKNHLGTTIRHGVVARIQELSSAGARAPFLQDVVIPASSAGGLQVDVPAGRFRIQAMLPSGEVLQQDILLKEGASQTVRFESHSPREWLSWQKFDGARLEPADLAEDAPRLHGNELDVANVDRRSRAVASAAKFLEMPRLGPLAWQKASASKLADVVKDWRPATDVERGGEDGAGKVAVLRFKAQIQPTPRYWIAMRAHDVSSLISVPGPWMDETFTRVEMEVLFERGEASRRSTTSLIVRDSTMGGLLAYLGQGRLASAKTLLSGLDKEGLIVRAIEEKGRNPLAACAGAYVGLAIFEPGEAEVWDAWLPNVMNWFDWLPDGAVVHAVRIFQRPGGSREMASLAGVVRTAYERGIPYFTAGVLHLRELLETIANEKGGDVATMLKDVSAVAARLDPGQTFTTLRYSS